MLASHDSQVTDLTYFDRQGLARKRADLRNRFENRPWSGSPILRIISSPDRHTGMTTTYPLTRSNYAAAYGKGRHAAKEHIPVTDNPFRSGSSEFHGWNDGHYDEQSARNIEIQRHSALVWSRSDAN
jgi:hypothetical protein